MFFLFFLFKRKPSWFQSSGIKYTTVRFLSLSLYFNPLLSYVLVWPHFHSLVFRYKEALKGPEQRKTVNFCTQSHRLSWWRPGVHTPGCSAIAFLCFSVPLEAMCSSQDLLKLFLLYFLRHAASEWVWKKQSGYSSCLLHITCSVLEKEAIPFYLLVKVLGHWGRFQ